VPTAEYRIPNYLTSVTLVERSMGPVNPSLDVYVNQAYGVADARSLLGAVTVVDPVTASVEFGVAETLVRFSPRITSGYITVEFTDSGVPLIGVAPGSGRFKTHVVNGEINRIELLSGYSPTVIQRMNEQESIKYAADHPFASFKIVEYSMDSADSNTAANVYNKAEVDALIP